MAYPGSRHFLMLLAGSVALIMSLALAGTAEASSLRSKPVPPVLPTCGSGCGGDLFYGANQSWMSSAVTKASWPQKRDYWCGVADIAAINWYDQIKTYGTGVRPTWATQDSIGDDTRGHTSPSGIYYPPDPTDGLLNTASAISPWGQAQPVPPAPYHYPAFKADIAGDSGTDPRSLAWGLWEVTPNGFYFHNWIYETNAVTATDYFSSDYGPAHGLNDPIIVDINQGSHSFVIDGVYAQSDPSAGGTVDAIDTWDPGYAGPGTSYNSSQQEVWSMYDWTNYQYPSGAYLYAKPYSNTANGGYDPEPSTNPGYYDPESGGVQHHWNTYYVTIEQDLVTRCNASPDIAYTQTGAEAAHNGSAYCP